MKALAILLAIIWSLLYWVGGGVLFALVSLLRLGRVRKVRFSCLFSLLAFACGAAAAYVGVFRSRETIDACLVDATTRAETLVALVGCGMGTILIAFLLGAAALVAGGFVIMWLSSTATKPWVQLSETELEDGEEPEEPIVESE
ncbi:hypothetical protein A2856_00360 [Candidatus Uhrbacteria bacterium RIFCSPHIGHO2_01_FULL_63_20]|uniref:Major facilitator superfamily (MFS) profile domain-containing protein n=1 Tax=Candidatus Uhrbacteria bacterium RIFCSPHIGHO2_01_FULL_63_20 TaxID=1802385 RepID=A0A1F7TLT8_9BACT|nr:MAG: hypothetical protein A2856_00360 [Candidatus Uhrbacteria bacterium RIFCSPHIGHO2_01_FULL_63_20]